MKPLTANETMFGDQFATSIDQSEMFAHTATPLTHKSTKNNFYLTCLDTINDSNENVLKKPMKTRNSLVSKLMPKTINVSSKFLTQRDSKTEFKQRSNTVCDV